MGEGVAAAGSQPCHIPNCPKLHCWGCWEHVANNRNAPVDSPQRYYCFGCSDMARFCPSGPPANLDRDGLSQWYKDPSWTPPPIIYREYVPTPVPEELQKDALKRAMDDLDRDKKNQ